jgi:hypothetical protein
MQDFAGRLAMRALKWMVIAALVAAGCGDKTTINNYYFPNGAVSGRITPADPGTMVMTADSVRVKYADANGFFVLDSLPSGVYNIVIIPVHFSRREFKEVTVAAGQIVSLGDIRLSNYPHPFFESFPADGEDSVQVHTYIMLYAAEPVVIDDLRRLATITPTINGAWGEWPTSSETMGELRYVFVTDRDAMRVATEYQVEVPSSVRLLDGDSLGSDLFFSFTTEPLRFQLLGLSEGLMGGVSISDFAPVLWFNSAIDADSLTKAVSFTPPIGGIWVETAKAYGNAQYTFLATSGVPLLPETDYAMIVSDRVALADGLRLPKPDTTRFTTEPYGVIQSYPRNGTRMHCTQCGITLEFNTPMDSASVREAFSLRDMEFDTLVTGTFTLSYDPHHMQFIAAGALRSGTVYRYTLSRTARTASGQMLSQNLVVTFQVEDYSWGGSELFTWPEVPAGDRVSKSSAIARR